MNIGDSRRQLIRGSVENILNILMINYKIMKGWLATANGSYQVPLHPTNCPLGMYYINVPIKIKPSLLFIVTVPIYNYNNLHMSVTNTCSTFSGVEGWCFVMEKQYRIDDLFFFFGLGVRWHISGEKHIGLISGLPRRWIGLKRPGLSLS
jgi:hypothetical protein